MNAYDNMLVVVICGFYEEIHCLCEIQCMLFGGFYGLNALFELSSMHD